MCSVFVVLLCFFFVSVFVYLVFVQCCFLFSYKKKKSKLSGHFHCFGMIEETDVSTSAIRRPLPNSRGNFPQLTTASPCSVCTLKK